MASLGRGPFITASICAAAWLVHLHPERLSLAFAPDAPTLGQLLGCHLVHLSAKHLLWDTATFLVVGAVSEWWDRRRFLWFLAGAALVVPPLACLMRPDIAHYAGLSGLVIGQATMWIAVRMRREMGVTEWWRGVAPWGVLLGLVLLKQVYEVAVGNTSVVTLDYEGFVTVPEAHLWSALLGVAIGLGVRSTSSPWRKEVARVAGTDVADGLVR